MERSALGILAGGIEPLGGDVMAKRAMVDELVAVLISVKQRRVERDGGYPDQVEIVGSHVVVAGVDHKGAPELFSMPLSGALERFARAKRYHRQRHVSWSEALGETGLPI